MHDKGNAVIIQNKNEYMSKISKLLKSGIKLKKLINEKSYKYLTQNHCVYSSSRFLTEEVQSDLDITVLLVA